jgi:uncharacterized membrane protein YgcG
MHGQQMEQLMNTNRRGSVFILSIARARRGTLYSPGGRSFWWALLWTLSNSRGNSGGGFSGGFGGGGGGFFGGGGRGGGGGASGSW